jgi:hypothetical protein
VPGNTKRENRPQPRDTHTAATNPPPRGGAANWADTLSKANTAFDDDQMGTARQLATSVFNTRDDIPNEMRASAAMVVATTHVSASRPADAITWYQNALRYASPTQTQRINTMLAQLRGSP